MDSREEKVDDIVIYYLSGRLDATNADEVLKKISMLAKSGQHRFVFDLENLDYISSSGLRIFLELQKSLPAHGFVRFCKVKNQVLEVFTISGFNSIFQIFQEKEEALHG